MVNLLYLFICMCVDFMAKHCFSKLKTEHLRSFQYQSKKQKFYLFTYFSVEKISSDLSNRLYNNYSHEEKLSLV